MKRKITLLLGVAILMLTGCSDYKQSKKLSSVSSETLTGEVVEFKQDITLPLELFCTENGIFVFEDTNSGFLKYAPYNLESMSVFGEKGTDTKRFMTPKIDQLNPKELILTSFNSNNVIVSGEPNGKIDVKSVDFKNKELFLNAKYVSYFDTDKYITTERSENQINIADDNKGVFECYNIFPFNIEDSEVSKYHLVNTIFTSDMSYNKEQNILFIAYTNYPFATTIDMEHKRVIKQVEVKDGDDKQNVYTKRGSDDVLFLDPILFYTQSVTTKNYNWALYHGCTMGGIPTNKSEIHQFSKSGKILKRYILDRSIFNFGITPNEEDLYTINVNSNSTYTFMKYEI